MSQQYPQDPQSQYPAGGPPQPGYQAPAGAPPGWSPPKPPKKPFFKRTWFIVVASIVGLIVLVSVIPSNGDGTTASTASDPSTSAPIQQPKASTKPSASAPATTQAPKAPEVAKCTGSRNDPCPVKLGVAYTVGKHTMSRGWKLKTQEYVGTQLVGTLTMTSDDDEPSTAFFTVKFLKGNQVVANFQCSSSELEKGQTEDIECHNMSDVTKPLKAGTYDKITAEADF
jgi:hypothetical protein